MHVQTVYENARGCGTRAYPCEGGENSNPGNAPVIALTYQQQAMLPGVAYCFAIYGALALLAMLVFRK